MKICTRCHEEKDESEFSRRGTEGRLRSRCRPCRQKDYLDYIQDPKAAEHSREYHKQWYLDHKERVTNQSREWIRNNPEKRRALIRANQERRMARARNLPATLTQEEWNKALALFGNRCAYCDRASPKLHQEHFIPIVMGGGYEAGNIIPACPTCNHIKKAKPPLKFLGIQKYAEIMLRIHGA